MKESGIYSRGMMIHLPEKPIDSINNIAVLKYYEK